MTSKAPTPMWLKESVLRLTVLVGSACLMIMTRLRIMGSQLPVFTKYVKYKSLIVLIEIYYYQQIRQSGGCGRNTVTTINIQFSAANELMAVVISVKFVL